MDRRPSYAELKQRVKELEKQSVQLNRMQTALRQSEERYRRITEAITDFIYTVRVENGRPIETVYGPTCMSVTGYTIEAYNRNPYLWIQMVHKQDRERVEKEVALAVSGVKVGAIEHRIIRKDGAVRWVRNTRVQNYDTHGRLLSYDGLVQDITERKIAEEALRKSEEKYRTIFESTGTATIIGDENTTILMVNSEFEDLSGYSKDEIVGKKSWTEFVEKDDLEALMGYYHLRRIDPAVAPRNHEFRFIDRHGNVRHVIVTVTMIPGTTNGVASFSDITTEKLAQKKLRKINEELNNFVNVVSHDLKTPIICIQGFISRLLKSHEETLGEKDLERLGLIKDNARRMELLVTDLLALASNDQVVSAFENVPSLEILRRTTLALQDSLRARGIDLVVADNLPVIRCDKERICQVFDNLFVNAIKFSAGVQHPMIEIGCNYREGSHEFYIRDNGIGIDPKYHRKIFERFQRLRDIEDQEGTGLGLAIVERIVKNHGGTVWVESEKGKGATFHFTVPKASNPSSDN